MSRQSTVARIEEIADRVGEAENVEIVDVELKGAGRNQLLRVYIDKPGGVTHGDCERVSNAVGAILDEEDVVPGEYTLEVSSPGVERKLKKLADYARFTGQPAKLVVREAEGKNKFIEGMLAGTEGADVLIEPPNGERLRVPFASIDRANLKFEW
jgi:ribosome maturation factor RimP